MTIRGNRRLRARQREARKWLRAYGLDLSTGLVTMTLAQEAEVRAALGLRQSAPMTYDARETVWFPLDGGPPRIGEPMPEIGGITFRSGPDDGYKILSGADLFNPSREFIAHLSAVDSDD